MSFRRYIAATVREGLDRVRRELGEDAVILSNKRLGPGRIEIVAAASDSMDALVEQADRPHAVARPAPAARERVDAMQVESFQEFVRRQTPATTPPRASRVETAPARPAARAEQPATRGGVASVARHAEGGVAMYHEVARAQVEPELDSEAFAPVAAAPAEPDPAPAVFRQRTAREAEARAVASVPARPPQARVARAPVAAAPAAVAPAPARLTQTAVNRALPSMPPAPPEPAAMPQPAPAPAPRPLPASAAPPEVAAPLLKERAESEVMAELRSLRAALSDRIAALESNIAVKQTPAPVAAAPARNPAATRVMTRLLMSGFSPDLARRVAAYAPTTSDVGTTDIWLHEVIAGNLRCASGGDGLMEGQGAIALVGPTGVGKTTTVAKLAARFAVRYGAAQLALITLDSYRIGAHEQLRSYGRILGVPMHIAQDGATLRELLASLQGKRLVLIDTCGVSQRDERMEEMLGTLAAARFNMQPVRRVLLLNGSSHSETLDEVARAWHAQDAGGAILTKLDEAARIGGAVDCLLRYRMTLFGLTNGQRVPEDWHQAGARLIAHVALKPSTSPFALGDDEARAWSEQPLGSMHA